MIRRYILLSLLFFVASLCGAQKINREQAERKAMTFMRQIGVHVEKGLSSAPFSHLSIDQAPIYVFNATDGNGFVIVSGDGQTEEILGYGTDCQFDEKRLSETMREWLSGYASQITDLQKSRMKNTPMKVSTHPAVGKLVTSQWDQGEATSTGNAYNQLCPSINGKRCAVGCVAAAMAQVMRYYRWPTDYCRQIPSYTSNGTLGQLKGLSKLKFDWNNMLDRYDEGQTDKECKAVAQLMQYCGYSVSMDYGTTTSSATFHDAAKALRTYFDYDLNTRYVDRCDYSAEGWDNLIYDEISNGRPVLYTGFNPGGGHAFICDGYDGNGFYHVNWGWGGYCNGYFKLSILNPRGGGIGSSSSNNGYSVNQGAIVGIRKPTNATYELRTLSLMDFKRSGHTLTAQYVNYTGIAGTFDYGIAYQNVSEGGDSYQTRKSSASFEPMVVRSYNLDLDKVGLSDGTYNFYPYTILSGGKWYHMTCDFTKYYEVKVSGGQVSKITYHPISSLFISSLECVSSHVVNQPQEIKFSIKNEGEEYSDKLYLFASKTNNKGKYVDEICLPVESGGEEQASLFFKPNSTGKWKIWLDIKEDGSSGLSPWEIDIVGPPTSKTNLKVVSYEIIPSTDVVFKAKIKNNSTEGYYMPILCFLFQSQKQYNIDYQKTRHLNLGPGETTDLEFCFESLEMGKTYSVHMRDYINHQSEETEWLGNSYKFTINNMDQPTDITFTHRPPAPVNVYSISGVRLRERTTSLEGLPDGIYIVDGKKRMVKN